MKPPVIIGGLGGSGTRVVARIVREAGYFIGTGLNVSDDAMEFVEFYDRWINRYIMRKKVPLVLEEQELMNRDIAACVASHRAEIPFQDALWGWKNPRTIHLLPFFHAQFPGMKFLHVIRDGRDMAFSDNNVQLQRHGAAILDCDVLDAPQPIKSAALWALVNLEAAFYGELHLAENYLLVKFETLCARPRDVVGVILHFLGCSNRDAALLARDVAPPSTLGRWRNLHDGTLQRIHTHAEDALRKFGYW